jgi:hypothetical protein
MSLLSILASTLKQTALSAFSPVSASFGVDPKEESKTDERDWKYEVVREDKQVGAAYAPKNKRVLIKTVSIKDQRPYNTCTFASALAQKEVDEGVELSLRSLVAYATRAGYISGNGYSSLRLSQQALINYGAAEASLVKEEPKNDWITYSKHYTLSSAQVRENAAKYKAKSQLVLNTQSDWFHALDNGRVIQTGCGWYTGYNGLGAPFTLQIGKGVYVSGHAFICIGYDVDKKVFIFQNSFGPAWGDGGKFYVRFADFSALFIGRLTVDMPNLVAKVASSYEGKDVKADGDPRIFRVQDGKKRVFPNEQIFFSWGGRFGTDKTWVLVAKSVISSLPDGVPMTLKK